MSVLISVWVIHSFVLQWQKYWFCHVRNTYSRYSEKRFHHTQPLRCVHLDPVHYVTCYIATTFYPGTWWSRHFIRYQLYCFSIVGRGLTAQCEYSLSLISNTPFPPSLVYPLLSWYIVCDQGLRHQFDSIAIGVNTLAILGVVTVIYKPFAAKILL